MGFKITTRVVGCRNRMKTCQGQNSKAVWVEAGGIAAVLDVRVESCVKETCMTCFEEVLLLMFVLIVVVLGDG